VFSRTAAVALLILCCLLVSACKEEPAPGIRRVAVLGFENLSSDAAFDWVGPALADIMVEQFRGAVDVHVASYPSTRSAAVFRPTHLLQGYLNVRGGECIINLSFEDIAAREVVDHRELRGALPTDTMRVARDAAQLIGTPLREFGTSSPDAIRSYGGALVAQENEQRTNLLAAALAEDDEFQQAALALARIYAGTRRVEEAGELLSKVLESSVADPIAKSEAQLILLTINGTGEARAKALADYAGLVPADSGAAERAAQALLNLSDYRAAAGWYRKAVAVEPDRTDLWNSAAYPLAYAGDFAGAVAALERYQQAEPGNPNTYDSLGEIHFRFGEFETAEQYFLKAVETDPTFQGAAALVKAARCHLYRGDREGADQLFKEYAVGRRDLNDQTIELRQAQWSYGSGRGQEAIEGLQASVEKEGVEPIAVALAYGQLAFWHITAGEIGAAKTNMQSAAQSLPRGVVDRAALVCQLLIRHIEAPDAWRQIARQPAAQPGQEELHREALIYAHLLAGRFEEAIPLLQAVIDQAAPFAEDEWNILLAWATFETGDAERAGELLSTYPIIQPSTESAFYGLVFPRLLYLKGALAAEAGRRDDADAWLRMFVEYAGELPDTAGNLEKAKQLIVELGG
jgi:tetratricopeptide (TPR) repeat protein